MNKKRNRALLIATGIVLLVIILYFRPFSSSQIIILDHLTEMTDDGIEDQICLVKNPPYFSATLKKDIEKFNKNNPVKGKYFRRLFIKEHDKVWFPNLFLQENVDYESKKTTIHDLNNIDFLAKSNYELTKDGSIYSSNRCYTGELWYYKY